MWGKLNLPLYHPADIQMLNFIDRKEPSRAVKIVSFSVVCFLTGCLWFLLVKFVYGVYFSKYPSDTLCMMCGICGVLVGLISLKVYTKSWIKIFFWSIATCYLSLLFLQILSLMYNDKIIVWGPTFLFYGLLYSHLCLPLSLIIYVLAFVNHLFCRKMAEKMHLIDINIESSNESLHRTEH